MELPGGSTQDLDEFPAEPTGFPGGLDAQQTGEVGPHTWKPTVAVHRDGAAQPRRRKGQGVAVCARDPAPPSRMCGLRPRASSFMSYLGDQQNTSLSQGPVPGDALDPRV